MTPRAILASALLGLGLAGPAAAADFSDPTWPCIQRKVPELSIGLMWPHPVEPGALDPETEKDARALAERMSLRRVSLEDLPPRIAGFTQAHGTDPTVLGHVFQLAFDTLSRQRRTIMKGIESYSLKQISLAGRIDETRTEMDTLMAAENPDFDRVDALEERLAWDERIYTDRAQSLTYVCETPVLLEKRLYSIAQMLQQAAN